MKLLCTALCCLAAPLGAQGSSTPTPGGAPAPAAAPAAHADSQPAADSGSGAGAAQNTAPPPSAVALFHAAHTWDMALAGLVAQHGSSDGVRDFGKQVVREDSLLRDQGAALAKKFNTPVPPMGEEDKAKLHEVLSSLEEQHGKDFDKAALKQMHDFEQSFTDGIADDDQTPMGRLLGQAVGVWKAHVTRIDQLLGTSKPQSH